MTLLAGLPVFGVLLGQAMGARPLHLLLDKPIGWGLLSAAAVLDAAGIWLTGLITRFATRC
jgi:tight adherence protein B